MTQGALRWLADENFPVPAYRVLREAGWDVEHVGLTEPGLPDTEVMNRAIRQGRILLTFDNDHGTLVFRQGYRPPGVVHFRLMDYLPATPANTLLTLEKAGWAFQDRFTVIDDAQIRQRSIPA